MTTRFERLARRGWLEYWRMFQRYHRYSIEGLERLDGEHSMLIAGYHGRPLAFDMCMFTVAFYDHFGYLPHGVVHRGLESFPPLKAFTEALGFVVDDGPEVARAERAHDRIEQHAVWLMRQYPLDLVDREPGFPEHLERAALQG